MPIIEGEDAAAFIQGRILGQVANLPVITPGKSQGIIDDLATIKDRINALEMSGGPANVTAFRDFYSLQLAFKDVWTAALDGALEDDVMELYKHVNVLNTEHGEVFPDPNTLADITQFEDFIESIHDDLMDESLRVDSIPSNVQDAFPTMDDTTWNQFTPAAQDRLDRGVSEINGYDFYTDPEKRWRFDELLREVNNNPNYQTSLGRLQRLAFELSDRLRCPYSFKYYKEYSVNYGILVNYRQEWRPQNYQVGRLVSTLPLAPGESREFKVRRKIKMTRAEREVRKSLAEQQYESSSVVKSELDVLAKLATDTNFKMSAQGSFSIGIGSIDSTSEFSHNQKAESQRQHKQISEATKKASEKVRQEREVSVEESMESEVESESSQKIHNPNNEVTVTYLMYELERRYQVSQSVNRVTPVILVALDMPSPHEITEGWILEHSWILRRVLLADQFEGAIDWIEDGRQAESFDVAVKQANYEREVTTLKSIETELDAVLADRRLMREDVITLEERKAKYEAGDDGAAGDIKDFFLSGGFSLFSSDDGPDQGEVLQAGVDAAKARLKYTEERAELLASQQRASKREAREAGREYAEALKAIAQKDTLIKQFQLHLRQNIFHYMHAIWESKHPDELFFQLVEQDVYHLGGEVVECELTPVASPNSKIPGVQYGEYAYEIQCAPPDLPNLVSDDPTVEMPAAEVEAELELLRKPLGQVAHVDQLLGFKGNYAVFPLKECSPLTDFMAQEFVDDYLGVRDPTMEFGVSTPELIEYARQAIQSGRLEPEEVDQLKAAVARAVGSPNLNTEEIVLPTGQIYMEALKGEQVLLEDFKLGHRGIDLLKAQEDVRQQRIENLRRAGRMTGENPNFGDSEIEKAIIVDSDNDIIVSP